MTRGISERIVRAIGALTLALAVLVLTAVPQMSASAASYKSSAILVWTEELSWYTFDSVTDGVYDPGDGLYTEITSGGTVSGLSYSSSSNTLTMTDFNNPEAVIFLRGMGSDFKINLVGENHVLTIVAYYDGSSIEFTGSGSLTVNELQKYADMDAANEKFGFCYGIEVMDGSVTVGSGVTLVVYDYEPYAGLGEHAISASNLTINGSLQTGLIKGEYGSYTSDIDAIVIVPAGSDGADTAGSADTAATAGSSTVDISSLPVTAGAVGYAAMDPSMQDALFANGIGVLSTAESNAYVTSIGVEGWEVHFWAEGLPVATLGVVDASGSPVTISNASLITVDGAAYLNFESTGAAAYALTSEEGAAAMQSVFGVTGIAVNGSPLTTLW